jgi:hypothetical protein
MYKKRILMLAAVSVVCMMLSAQGIRQQVCWIDSDFEHALSSQTMAPALDISSLSAGVHTFTIRIQDTNGLWSAPVTKYFIVPATVTAATNIAAREYWIDGNIVARSELGASPAEISLVELSAGMHTLTARVKDDAGLWSAPVTKYFVVPTASMQEQATLARYLYWFDDDQEHRVVGTATEPSGVLDIALDGLTSGEHQLTLCFIDSKGAASQLVVQTFKFIVKGDANGDGTVDVSDYIGIANYIMGNVPEGFNDKAADVNDDGVIDVSDYIGVANLILYGNISGN